MGTVVMTFLCNLRSNFRLSKRRFRQLLAIFLVTTFTSGAFAQGSTRGEKMVGPRKQLATIIFSGLGGAILGLSTLSFYGRPQDKLSNIAIGFAVGVIVGTSYVTYKAASDPRELYGLQRPEMPQSESMMLSGRELALRQPDGQPPMNLGLTFEF